MENPKLQFMVKGFTEVTGVRVFEFECVEPDKSRTQFTVRADLAMARRYGIRIQELPLLCRAVLEQRGEGEARRAFTYSEAEMRAFADSARARADAAKQKRPARRPVQDSTASPWRVTPL